MPPDPATRKPAAQGPISRQPLRSVVLHLLLGIAVTGVALGLRLHELGEESVWIDEAITHERSGLKPKALIHDTLRRKHIPTYFLMMHYYLDACGDDEFMLRLPSAIAGTGTVALGYATGAVLGGPVAGIVTGMLLATSESQVHYSQEARMYACMTLFSALALLCLGGLLRAPSENGRAPWALRPRAAPDRRVLLAWIGLCVGTLGTLYLHNTAVFFVAGLQVGGLCVLAYGTRDRRGFVRNWMVWQGVAFACWSPWIRHLIEQAGTFDRWKQEDFAWTTTGEHISEIMAFDQTSGPILWLVLAGAVLAFVRRADRGAAAMLLAVVLTGLGACVYVSLTKANMLLVRTLLWTAIPTFSLVGLGLSRWPRAVGLVPLAALLWLSAPSLAEYYDKRDKPPWRDLMLELIERTDNDSVIVSAGANRFVHYYFKRRDNPLTYRSFKSYGRQRRVSQLIGTPDRFWLLAKTNSGRAIRFQRQLRKGPHYKRIFYRRGRSAMLAQYELQRARQERKRELRRARARARRQDREAKHAQESAAQPKEPPPPSRAQAKPSEEPPQ